MTHRNVSVFVLIFEQKAKPTVTRATINTRLAVSELVHISAGSSFEKSNNPQITGEPTLLLSRLTQLTQWI